MGDLSEIYQGRGNFWKIFRGRSPRKIFQKFPRTLGDFRQIPHKFSVSQDHMQN